MGHVHWSRRDVLESIAACGKGTLLAPLFRGAPLQPAGALRGSVLDGGSGRETAAKMRVTDAVSGTEFWPERAIRTMPQTPRKGGKRYFYVNGEYELALPSGQYKVEVVRGIDHEPVVHEVTVKPGGTEVFVARVPVLRDMRAAGWYSGNTHTHFQVEMDEDPDDHLRTVPPAEALDVSVISYLIRGNLPYKSNKYRIGRLPEFSRGGTLVDMGEECRNNKGNYEFGYGHVLFLNIPRLVEPVSTGLLSPKPNAPDFPTISMLCEEAKRIGGTTIWCHNGQGMELPVAAALGYIDAFNVGDSEPGEYNRYYEFLNCGFRMPLSTGTDWWIYDHNRVYVRTEGPFGYESWLAGLKAGRAFITNGPLLDLRVNRKGPGDEIKGPGIAEVQVEAVSRQPFTRIEVVHDGEIVAQATSRDGRSAKLQTAVRFDKPGWIAARVASDWITHGGFRGFAHTAPVYLAAPGRPRRQAEAAGRFVKELEESMAFIRKRYRFQSEADLATALGRFAQGREYYARLSR